MPVPVFTTGEVLTAANMNQVGLWLIKTQTVGSGVGSVTVPNAFSQNFQNYRVVWTGGTASATSDIGVRIGSAAANYYGFLIYGSYSSATVSGLNDSAQTMFRYVGGADAFYSSVTFDVYRPYEAAVTTIAAQNNLGGSNLGTYQGRLADTNSYTSFTLLHTLGTSTLTGGTIRVYGYRN